MYKHGAHRSFRPPPRGVWFEEAGKGDAQHVFGDAQGMTYRMRKLMRKTNKRAEAARWWRSTCVSRERLFVRVSRATLYYDFACWATCVPDQLSRPDKKSSMLLPGPKRADAKKVRSLVRGGEALDLFDGGVFGTLRAGEGELSRVTTCVLPGDQVLSCRSALLASRRSFRLRAAQHGPAGRRHFEGAQRIAGGRAPSSPVRSASTHHEHGVERTSTRG